MKYFILKNGSWLKTNRLIYDLFIGEKKIGFRVSKENRFNSPKTMRLFTRILVRNPKGISYEK